MLIKLKINVYFGITFKINLDPQFATLFVIIGGRGNAHFQTSVDRRPSKIKISGFDADDKVFYNVTQIGASNVIIILKMQSDTFTYVFLSLFFQEAIIAQFRRFGEVIETMDTDISELESENSSLVIHYRTRKESEMAMLKRKTFGEQPLQLSW